MNNIDSFSEREQEVIELLVQGKSNKQIALQLKISNRTVEFHLSNIYSKLGVSSRTEAVLLFMKDASAELVEEPVETTWRESTDAPKDELSYNGEKRKQRDFMKKRTYYLIGSGLLIAVLLALAFVIAPDHDLKNLLADISGEYSDIVPVAVATPQEDGAIIHTVEEGQTLWSIAAAYGITVEQLRQMNGSPVESDIIYVGQKLYIQPSPSLDPEVTSTVSFYVQTSEDENTYIKELDSSTLTLIVKWFYIDETRLYLDLLVSGYPLPEDFSPVQIIDLQNIIIHRADGSLIDLENAERYGSVGGAGGNDSQEEELRFFEGIIDVGLPSSIEENSQKETYTIEIPIGGEVYAEDGEVRTLPVESFSIDVKPSYVGQLTFSTVKTAVIDDKTVIFRGIEINPSKLRCCFVFLIRREINGCPLFISFIRGMNLVKLGFF
jgi:DNA-binding CsgD family transcriptional regulator